MEYYYIIKIKPNLIKVGITKNLAQRLRAYRTSDPSLVFHKTYELDIDRKEISRLERLILAELRRFYTCSRETIQTDSLRAVEMFVDGLIEEYTGI